jgi:hypothetical protein
MSDVMMKSPDDVLDYDVDFGRWLPDGDIITQGEATITSATAEITQVETSETIARVWIQGGLNNEVGDVKVTIWTREGRVKTTGFKLRIKDLT